jgi:ribosome-associated protein
MANKKTAAARSAKRSHSPARKPGRAGPARKKAPTPRRAPARKPPRKPPREQPAPAVPVPAPAPAPAAPEVDEARPTAMAIAAAALDKKAEDVTVLDVRGLTSYADYFVVMTADSDRQAGAIADHVEQTMKAKGVSKVGVEGYESGRWILVDYGDVVAHVMNRESRGFYDLEGLWADAPRFTVT